MIKADNQKWITSYLALGGNIGDAKSTITKGIEHLGTMDGIRIVDISKYYSNIAVGGPSDQPDFVNCACKIETALQPLKLLEQCLSVERDFGRIRAQKWGPRTLDIDILLYGDTSIEIDGLSIPHPRLKERLFVLIPLTDIAPLDLKIDDNGRILKDIVIERLEFEGQTQAQWNSKVVP